VRPKQVSKQDCQASVFIFSTINGFVLFLFWGRGGGHYPESWFSVQTKCNGIMGSTGVLFRPIESPTIHITNELVKLRINMGVDCFCAICSGPNLGVIISEAPRSAHFKRRLEATLAKRELENIPDDEFTFLEQLDPLPGEELPALALAGDEEENKYDGEILTKGDFEWSLSFYAVALHTYNDDIKE
jgi:hypothetical protein